MVAVSRSDEMRNVEGLPKSTVPDPFSPPQVCEAKVNNGIKKILKWIEHLTNKEPPPKQTGCVRGCQGQHITDHVPTNMLKYTRVNATA